MEFAGIIAMTVLAGVIALFYIGNKYKLEGEEPGEGVMRLINDRKKTALLIATFGILFSEALLAGSIHPENELYVSPEGRMAQHLVISFIGFLVTVNFNSLIIELRNPEIRKKYSLWNIIFRLALSGILSIAIPLANIFLIAKGLGHHNTMLDWIFKITHSADNWDAYKSYYGLAADYDPLTNMPYALFGTIIGVGVAFLLILLEVSSIYSVFKEDKDNKKSKENKDESKNGKSDKSDSNKSDKKDKDNSDSKQRATLEYKVAKILAKSGKENELYDFIYDTTNSSKVPTAIYALVQSRLREIAGKFELEKDDNKKKVLAKALLGVLVNKLPNDSELKDFTDEKKQYGCASSSYDEYKHLIEDKYLVTPIK